MNTIASESSADPLFRYYALVVWWATDRVSSGRLSIDAHDVAQEVFTRALVADRPDLEGPRLRGWLLEIARRYVLEEQRWEMGRPRVPSTLRSSRIPAPVSSVGSRIRRRESVEQFGRWAGENLGDRDRTLLGLVIEGASNAECAEVLGVSASRVADLKTALRQRLRSAPVELVRDFVTPLDEGTGPKE